jgi:uncharacterized protein YndB with AHSA1/START domain
MMVAYAAVFLALLSCSHRDRGLVGKGTDLLLDEGKVITRVERMPESGARSGEAEGVIDAPPESVWKIISDYNHHKEFMPSILDSFTIRPEALQLLEGIRPGELRALESQLRQYKTDEPPGRVVYLYGVGDFPWPIADKGYILKVARDPDHYTTHASMVIGQMKVNESFWELKPYGPNGSKTLARYRIILDPGVPVPGFLIDIATNSTLPDVIRAVRQRVKDTGPAAPGRGQAPGQQSGHRTGETQIARFKAWEIRNTRPGVR